MNEEKTELGKIFDLSSADDDVLTVCLTVDTGLEWQAIDECKSKISENLRVFKDRGKIYFNTTIDDFSKVEKLRSIDNIYLVCDLRYVNFDPEDVEKNLEIIKTSANDYKQLTKYLNIWKQVTRYRGKLFPSQEEYERLVSQYNEEKKIAAERKKKGSRKRGRDPSLATEENILSYRVTCDRIGKHTFDSSTVSMIVGGELQDRYHWIVDLTSYQLEILCKINADEMMLQLRVTTESKHRRNITHFGPTTLRSTVAYGLLSLAEPKPGEIIVDPMCGGGSIPIEGAMEFPGSYVIAGDNHATAVERSRLNVEALKTSLKLDLIQWSVSHLPFRDSFIDIFVTDMPFGKRSGSVTDNRVQYKHYLLELSRVVKLKHGRLVLLTYDRRSITVALQATKGLFKTKKMLCVNMGGLPAACYVLKRTNMTFEEFKTPTATKKKSISRLIESS